MVLVASWKTGSPFQILWCQSVTTTSPSVSLLIRAQPPAAPLSNCSIESFPWPIFQRFKLLEIFDQWLVKNVLEIFQPTYCTYLLSALVGCRSLSHHPPRLKYFNEIKWLANNETSQFVALPIFLLRPVCFQIFFSEFYSRTPQVLDKHGTIQEI
jgi:hypothetical protein